MIAGQAREAKPAAMRAERQYEIDRQNRAMVEKIAAIQRGPASVPTAADAPPARSLNRPRRRRELDHVNQENIVRRMHFPAAHLESFN